jgi:hypothetical protein
MYEVRMKKYKDKVRKDETSCAQYMLNRDRYSSRRLFTTYFNFFAKMKICSQETSVPHIYFDCQVYEFFVHLSNEILIRGNFGDITIPRLASSCCTFTPPRPGFVLTLPDPPCPGKICPRPDSSPRFGL